ncbi:MAG: beta-ketoacyl synthase N-terminal-like domain-containing protein [Planctomycetota bacterium]|nr:beta-ketoacyl synthase N-terminal-like domain-containing protein [Planctomycetota bacterium]
MTQIRVAVTGFGILSALGRGVESNVKALQEGRSGLIARPEWEAEKLRSRVSGDIDLEPLRSEFDRKESRFLCDPALLAALAMRDAIEHAGLDQDTVSNLRTGLVMGTGGSSVPDAIALADRMRARGGSKVGAYFVPRIMGSAVTANLSNMFHIHGHSYSMTSACATSAHTIMHGFDLIRSGRQDRVFAGGAEDINVFCVASFDGMNALSIAYNDTPEKASRPLDRGRDGFVYSGGAGVLVLENFELAQQRGAKIWAILAGAGASCDGEDMVVPNRIGGEEAMRLSLEDANLQADQVDYVNLHGTSTPVGDTVEVEAIQNVFGAHVPSFSSTKSMTGHGLGAAGVQEAIFCALMMQGGFLAPNINLEDPEPMVDDLPIVRQSEDAQIGVALSNSFGFGGTNCSLVFKHPENN